MASTVKVLHLAEEYNYKTNMKKQIILLTEAQDPPPLDLHRCTICLEDMLVEGEQLVLLECMHGFHRECICKWIRSSPSCPS